MSRLVPLVALLALLGLTGPVSALEPTVSFAAHDGFVDFTLRQDGRPVAEAAVRVLDTQGQEVATGETDGQGIGAFPLPRHSPFTVEIRVAGRTSDPIPLSATPGQSGVEPAEVLLSFGLRPCCRVGAFRNRVSSREDVSAAPHLLPPWLYAIVLSSLVGFVVTAVYLLRLPTPSLPATPRDLS